MKDIEQYSKQCIKKYLSTYNLVLETVEKNDKYGIVGDLHLSIKIDNKKYDKRFDDSNLIEFGHLHYSVSENILHIDKIYIKSIYKPSIKLTKVLMLHLLALYSKDEEIDYVSLVSSSSKKGYEFCLACFYQKLGFEPVHFESKEMVKKCLNYIGKTEKNMCILCTCQIYSKTNKNIMNFQTEIAPHINLDFLQIEMKAMLPRLKKMLKEANNEINKLC